MKKILANNIKDIAESEKRSKDRAEAYKDFISAKQNLSDKLDDLNTTIEILSKKFFK